MQSEQSAPGVWACRRCAAQAVSELPGGFRGDPRNKRADPGNCSTCGLPSILFWIEPIAAEVVEVATNCGGCRYYQQREGPGAIDTGHCRRYPPQVYYDPLNLQVSQVIPEVWPIDFCGEFKPKAKP